jgi:hypothetical protein
VNPKEAIAEIAAKPQNELTFADIADACIYYIRVDYEAVGIRFCLNPFIPGEHIKATAAQLLSRSARMGGPSTLGKGGEPWPGMDVCKGYQLFKYEEIKQCLPETAGKNYRRLSASRH